MNQRKAKMAKAAAAEREADQYYDEFNQLIEQTYGVRKHGYLWENKSNLDKSHPDYKREKNFDIDNSIIQSSLCSAIPIICNAALALVDFGSDKRTLYFKTAVLYCATLKAWEHAFTLAAIALKKNTDRPFFQKYVDKYRGVKNINQDVVFDIDLFLNQLNEL